jgi:NADH-quinone oxidoreductase subunit G
MPTFYVDDQPIEFQPGETVLQAVYRHKEIRIPHYCFHPGLKVTAQCRQCLVEIVDMGNGKGIPKLQTSCSTPAADKMKVATANEKVKEGQRLVNEFLLVNHPLDCPICDQAGECDLQDTAFAFGSGHSEMEYEKRVYGWRQVGTFLMLERNRCIHCSRCERFSRDVEGGHDFGMFLRSHELTFDTYEDHQITHKFQGNLADICPVGAITNRDWRFKKRAWKFKKTPTVCTSCSTGCNVTLEQHENRVYRLKPRENPEVNRWWMCDEGRVGFDALNDRTARLLEPHARVRGELRAARWEAAYGAIAARVKALGVTGEQVLALADTHATNEQLFLLTVLLKAAFGGGAAYFPLRRDGPQEQPTHAPPDPFLYSLIMKDKTPNSAGAKALGLLGDEDDKRLKAALAQAPKLLLVLGAPWGDSPAILGAAKQAQLIVQIAAFPGAWRAVSDVLLPGHTHAEQHGTYTNKAGRVQRIRPGLRPPQESRDPLRILQELLAALGKPQELGSAEQVFNALGAQPGAFQGLNWQAVGDLGAVLPGARA